MHVGFQIITALFYLMVIKFNISLMNRKSLSESSENGRRMRFADKNRVDDVSILKGTSSQIFLSIIIVFHASLDQMDVTPDHQVKEGAEETKKGMTMVEERAEARARVMMAATRLQSTSVLNGETADNSAVGRKSQERLGSTEGERLKMEERKPLESVSLVMRAGEKPNMGERFALDRFSNKESRLVGEVEGEVDSDRGSSVDTTDDSGELY